MKITLHGAAGGEVTGSAYWVQTGKANILVDFGIFQGGKNAEAKNHRPSGLNSAALDAVILTHGHLDHTGRLPLLVKAGYAKPIYATSATCELAALILRDAAHIQAQEAERANRKRARAGLDPVEPLYTADDVERTVLQLQAIPYDQPLAVADGISARVVEAGHMLGSVSVELTVEEEGRKKVAVFSGDLGPKGLPILKDSTPLLYADAVFLESTYGDRDHRSLEETLHEAEEIIRQVAARKRKLLIPAFAIGRSQQMLYHFATLFHSGKVPTFPVYLDSPMANAATRIYEHHPELWDEETQELVRQGVLRPNLPNIHLCETAEDSKKLNDLPGPMAILAGSGMCHAGRILHHLKNNLWKPECVVMLVGFQGAGTLGRMLVDGAKMVRIFGEEIEVRAEIHTLNGFSAHAGQTDLLRWFHSLSQSKPRTVLVHGENAQRTALGELIHDRYHLDCDLPEQGDTISV